MTDQEDSNMPEKTLRKRQETKHPRLSLSGMCECVFQYACMCRVHSSAWPPLDIFCARIAVFILSGSVMSALECDATLRLLK